MWRTSSISKFLRIRCDYVLFPHELHHSLFETFNLCMVRLRFSDLNAHLATPAFLSYQIPLSSPPEFGFSTDHSIVFWRDATYAAVPHSGIVERLCLKLPEVSRVE